MIKNLFFTFLPLFIFNACSSVEYEKEIFSIAELHKISDEMVPSVGRYYQGSPQEVALNNEAIALNPKNAHAWRELGIPYLKRGIGHGFEPFYQKAVSLDSLSWIGWRGYVYLYFYRDYERAISDFNALDTLTPNFVDYPQAQSDQFMRGICHLKLKQYDTAIEFFQKYIDFESKEFGLKYIDSKALLFKAIAFIEKGNLAQANKDLALGRETFSNNAEIFYWSAKLALQVDSPKDAKLFLDIADKHFKLGNFAHRPYVEEFYQLYQSDLDELYAQFR